MSPLLMSIIVSLRPRMHTVPLLSRFASVVRLVSRICDRSAHQRLSSALTSSRKYTRELIVASSSDMRTISPIRRHGGFSSPAPTVWRSAPVSDSTTACNSPYTSAVLRSCPMICRPWLKTPLQCHRPRPQHYRTCLLPVIPRVYPLHSLLPSLYIPHRPSRYSQPALTS